MIRRIYSSISRSNNLDAIKFDHKPHIDHYTSPTDFLSYDIDVKDDLDLTPIFSNDILSPIPSRTDQLLLLSPITSIDSYQISPSELVQESNHEDRLEKITDLPLEVLMKIIELVYYDTIDFNSIDKILESFSKVELISKTFQLLSYKFLYKYGNFTRPHSFDKFLTNLKSSSFDLGNFVQVIDFESFTSIGLGRTGRMNQEIQMVTSSTILNCLKLTPNLTEFLASENIEDDLNSDVLNYLFNELPYLQALDFCGASSQQFLTAFELLQIDNPLKTLFKISFHDCSNLSIDVLTKILANLPNLRRLDLTHTCITSSALLKYLPSTCNLTHLSLSRCSRLTTRDLINFLINHPSINNHQLTWLNLSIDSSVVSPLTSNYLYFTLKRLNANNLQYLNLRGLPITDGCLKLITQRFPNLVTLSIGFGNLQFSDIYDFLENTPNIVNIDISGNKLSKSHILSMITLPHLKSIEFDTKILKDLTSNDGQSVRQGSIIWRFFDNNGRRSWIYKLNPSLYEYQQISQYGKILDLNLTFYDINTGKKIVNQNKKPEFLKYVGRKINCSIGFNKTRYSKHKQYLNNHDIEEVWPPDFTERGIYNYYSLNI